MASDTLGVKSDEPLTIGTYPWKTTHAMWLLERIAALEALLHEASLWIEDSPRVKGETPDPRKDLRKRIKAVLGGEVDGG